MIQQVKHVGIAVLDLERSIAFYQEIIGLQLRDRHKVNAGLEIASLAFPGSGEVEIELISDGDGASGTTGVVSHIAFGVSDIDQEWNRLKKFNVRLIDELPRSVANGAKIGFFLGPDGERLELYQEA